MPPEKPDLKTALDRVRHAADRGLTIIDLRELGLTSLPGELAQLPTVQRLDVRNNQLGALPSWICQLERIEHMDLRGNELAKLPPEIGRLTALRSLLLGWNKLSELPPEIGHLTALRELQLFANRLSELPLELGQLRFLKRLVLGGNPLRELPSEIGDLSALEDLDLGGTDLRVLPARIGHLTELMRLNLNGNSLDELPKEIGRLRALVQLLLRGNQLRQLPSEIGRLKSLERLDLGSNELRELPPEIGELTALRELSLTSNELRELPPEIGELKALTQIDLEHNRLSALPAGISRLTALEHLALGRNELTELPAELGELAALQVLEVGGNKLNREVLALLRSGLSGLQSYLRGLHSSARIYEAKLLVVGEGDVGKTCLAARLLRDEFAEGQPSTLGIEIQIDTLELPHPSEPANIKLRIWDFGGQVLYRATHQFYFSARSLYVVVWDPRRGADSCDVDGWIRRIRLRVGEAARVLVVASHCQEHRDIRIDKRGLLREHGDVIVGFYEIDSSDGTGMEELRGALAGHASHLEQMGELFPRNWHAARKKIQELARNYAYIQVAKMETVCSAHGLKDAEEVRGLSTLLHDLGDIIHYCDDESLRGFVVLQPGWLSKAIGFVLQDPETSAASGVLAHRHLSEIWSDHGHHDEPTFDSALHPYFLRLMEKFDVCYRLHGGQSSLVAELLAAEAPEDLSWDDRPTLEETELQMVCEMSTVPPGLVPWTIVRTHRYSTGMHWLQGALLQDEHYGDRALIELDLEGLSPALRVGVRAPYPAWLMNILRDTLEKLIGERWPGLNYQFSVPCPSEGCTGRFALPALYKAWERERAVVDCRSDCLEEIPVARLLTGFQPDGIPFDSSKVEEQRGRALDEIRLLQKQPTLEAREAPRFFSIVPATVKHCVNRFHVTLWCEMPGYQHPVSPIGKGGPGDYTIQVPRGRLSAIAVYATVTARLLKIVSQGQGEAFEAPTADYPDELLDQLEASLEVFRELADEGARGLETLEEIRDETRKPAEGWSNDQGERKHDLGVALRRIMATEGAAVRWLHQVLEEEDKTASWGLLRRVQDSGGELLWLCPTHYPLFEPGLPEL